jgi:hypothetical protein
MSEKTFAQSTKQVISKVLKVVHLRKEQPLTDISALLIRNINSQDTLSWWILQMPLARAKLTSAAQDLLPLVQPQVLFMQQQVWKLLSANLAP